MTRFVSERYPELNVIGLGVRFRGGVAEVDDAAVAAALARSTTPGVRLADGETLPADPGGEGGAEAPPSVRAPKAAWVAYASHVHNIPAEEADGMNKAELIKAYGRG